MDSCTIIQKSPAAATIFSQKTLRSNSAAFWQIDNIIVPARVHFAFARLCEVRCCHTYRTAQRIQSRPRTRAPHKQSRPSQAHRNICSRSLDCTMVLGVGHRNVVVVGVEDGSGVRLTKRLVKSQRPSTILDSPAMTAPNCSHVLWSAGLEW